MAKNTREMMVSLVSHLSERIETASPNADFGSGWSGAMAFVMESVKATVTEGDRGAPKLSEEEKAKRLMERAPFYLDIVQRCQWANAKATAGLILKNIKNNGLDLPGSEQNVSLDMEALALLGKVQKKETKGGRVYYETVPVPPASNQG